MDEPTADHSTLVEEELLARITKSEADVANRQAALERAESHLADLHIAYRVVFGSASSSKLHATNERQQAIMSLLKEGGQQAQTPKTLYGAYLGLGIEQVSIETFRTTIWRMAQMYRYPDWIVRSDERGYWKTKAEAQDAAMIHAIEASR